jgi:hypothetical protein
MVEVLASFFGDSDEIDEQALEQAFVKELSSFDQANTLFQAAADQFFGQELVEVCSELVQTIKVKCNADDFHQWNYDHLEFIIDQSNALGFQIPRNFLNGLPEQLIILVDKNKLGGNGCE